MSGCFATLQTSVSSAVSLTHRTTALPGGLHANNIKPTLANKQNNDLSETSNTKMQIAMSKKTKRLLIFGREGTVEMETVLGEICARLPSVHQRVREKSSHSGRTWRRVKEEETLLLPDGVKHPPESTC